MRLALEQTVLETRPPAWFTKIRCHLNHNQIVKDPRNDAATTVGTSFRRRFDRGRIPRFTPECPGTRPASNCLPQLLPRTGETHNIPACPELVKGQNASWQKFFSPRRTQKAAPAGASELLYRKLLGMQAIETENSVPALPRPPIPLHSPSFPLSRGRKTVRTRPRRQRPGDPEPVCWPTRYRSGGRRTLETALPRRTLQTTPQPSVCCTVGRGTRTSFRLVRKQARPHRLD